MEEKRFPVFARRFSELRGRQSQEEFARFLGISRPTVSYYENGTRVPDALILRQIAEKCNVSADWLIGLSNFKTAPQKCEFQTVDAVTDYFRRNFYDLVKATKERDLYCLIDGGAADVFPEHIEFAFMDAIKRCYWVLENIDKFKLDSGEINGTDILLFLGSGTRPARNK